MKKLLKLRLATGVKTPMAVGSSRANATTFLAVALLSGSAQAASAVMPEAAAACRWSWLRLGCRPSATCRFRPLQMRCCAVPLSAPVAKPVLEGPGVVVGSPTPHDFRLFCAAAALLVAALVLVLLYGRSRLFPVVICKGQDPALCSTPAPDPSRPSEEENADVTAVAEPSPPTVMESPGTASSLIMKFNSRFPSTPDMTGPTRSATSSPDSETGTNPDELPLGDIGARTIAAMGAPRTPRPGFEWLTNYEDVIAREEAARAARQPQFVEGDEAAAADGATTASGARSLTRRARSFPLRRAASFPRHVAHKLVRQLSFNKARHKRPPAVPKHAWTR